MNGYEVWYISLWLKRYDEGLPIFFIGAGHYAVGNPNLTDGGVQKKVLVNLEGESAYCLY